MGDFIEENPEFKERWLKCNIRQRKYVIARQRFAQKKEAAEHVGIAPRTAYNWPDYVEECVEMWENNRFNMAHEQMYQAWQIALERLVDIVENTDDSTFFKFFKYLTNQELGKPTAQTDVNVEGSVAVDQKDIDAQLSGFLSQAEKFASDSGEEE